MQKRGRGESRQWPGVGTDGIWDTGTLVHPGHWDVCEASLDSQDIAPLGRCGCLFHDGQRSVDDVAEPSSCRTTGHSDIE